MSHPRVSYNAIRTLGQSYPFGMVMPGRENYTTGFKYSFNSQESEIQLDEKGNTMSATHWIYSTSLGKRYNLDPVSKEDLSPYGCFSNSPVLFFDPLGDDIEHGSLKDKVNSTLLRIFNKGFRDNYRSWKNSPDMYYIKYAKSSGKRLAQSSPEHVENPSDDGLPFCNYKIEYSQGFQFRDITSDITRTAIVVTSVPVQAIFSAIKASASLLTGVGIGIWNLATDNSRSIGWGSAQRGYTPKTNYTIFGYGIGNYNKYNFIGQKPDQPIYSNGLISIRIGQGRKYPAMFFEIGNQIISRRNGNAYHIHLNILSKAKRNSDYQGESVIDFVNRPNPPTP